MADTLGDTHSSVPLDMNVGGASGWSRSSGVVFHRPNARGSIGATDGSHADNGDFDTAVGVESGDVSGGEADNGRGIRSTMVDKQDTIMLPQSTHSLFFTSNVCSLPFFYAVFVLGLSLGCLALALGDNLSGGSPGNPLNVPVNVSESVRGAQFLSILVALLMEEEIPTGTYLLRNVPRSSVQQKLGVSYAKFVFSNMVRLVIGYAFLLNVWLAVVQSDRVLDMFYDMLALNFVALCDDMAFKLAKYDVVGRTLRNACSAPYFNVEFEKRPYFFRKKMTIFVKILYVLNLVVFVGGTIAIAAAQRNGNFQCKSVTVSFGEEIWDKSWVETAPGQVENAVLVYSYFNGVYEQDGIQAGRPIYKERRKSDGTAFTSKIPAEIKYCTEEKAWVFTHERIKKSPTVEDSDCPWLMRSPETDSYDLLDVSGTWQIWVGVIDEDADVLITCNGCKDDTDCNLNGKCIDGRCDCSQASGHTGMHCELEEPCTQIIGEDYNDIWSVIKTPDCKPLLEYGRPVYTLLHIDDLFKNPTMNSANVTFRDEDFFSLVYSGSRWFGARIVNGTNQSPEFLESYAAEFHAFWDRIYDEKTLVISDPTTRSFPVGVDFYVIGKRGPQYGPFGVLHPLQQPPGRGVLRCIENATAGDAFSRNPACSTAPGASSKELVTFP